MSLKEAFFQLPAQRRSQIKAAFVRIYGQKSSFYGKLKGKQKIKPYEQEFFNLIQSKP